MPNKEINKKRIPESKNSDSMNVINLFLACVKLLQAENCEMGNMTKRRVSLRKIK
jgi:hypothetical protein